MVKTVTTKAKRAIADAAQRGFEGVRSITGDAGTAAKTAAEAVLESTTNALEIGRAKIKQSTPAMKRAIGITARRTVSKPVRGKTGAKRKTVKSRRKTKRQSHK
jgi:hypothetical protein